MGIRSTNLCGICGRTSHSFGAEWKCERGCGERKRPKEKIEYEIDESQSTYRSIKMVRLTWWNRILRRIGL